MLGRTLLHARKLGRGVREYGPRYLLRAPWNELRNPRLNVTRRLRYGLITVGEFFRPPRAASASWPDDCLLFVFDLASAPVTFDFATFLAGAEIERRRRGLEGIFVLFVPGRHRELREELPDYESAIGPTLRQWRIRHVLIPLLALLPSVRGHVMCPTRDKADAIMPMDPSRIFPDDFRVWLPRQPDKRVIHDHASAGVPVWPMLRATERGRQLVAEFVSTVCRGRRPVVITLRDSIVAVGRNSRIDEWAEFARGLDRGRFAPIFVHDSESTIDARPPALANETFCDAARWNLEIRMALYEVAWLNLAVMHGPMELCWYNERTRYLLFLDVGADPSSSEKAIAEGGQPIRRDLDFATAFQHIVWQADRAAIIRTAFDDMTQKLEAQTAGADRRVERA